MTGSQPHSPHSPEPLPAAHPEQVDLSREALARVRPTLQEFVDAGRIPGAVVAILRRGHVALCDTVGWRDVEQRKPMERETVFRIYSMTKPVTSAAVLILAEQGHLDLDLPVESYLPELADRRVLVDGETVPAQRSITTRDLLRHTSGMTYGLYGKSPLDQQYLRARVLDADAPLSTMVGKLRDLPLMSQPGQRFHYSVSVDVLGRLIEVISGMELDRFLATRILDPLGMRDTGFCVPAHAVSRFAHNYGSDSEGRLRMIDRAESSRYLRQSRLLSGGSGLVSTIDDYLRFCQMLLSGGELGGIRCLRPESVAAMTANQLVGSAYPISVGDDLRRGFGFGLGVSVVCEPPPGQPFVPRGEYGWGGAASTHFWISPRDDLAVIVLSQSMPFTLQLEWAIKPIVYGALLDRPNRVG